MGVICKKAKDIKVLISDEKHILDGKKGKSDKVGDERAEEHAEHVIIRTLVVLRV